MSGGDWFARRYHTGDLLGTGAHIVLQVSQRTTIKAFTIQLIIQNDPAFSGLRLKIYSYRDGAPQNLLATSTTSWDLATLKSRFTNPVNMWGKKHVYFDFSPFTLDDDAFYAIVLTADSYTGSYSSHLAWVIDYPNPVLVQAANNNLSALSQIGNVLTIIKQSALDLNSEKFLVRISPRDLLSGSSATLEHNGATFDTYYWPNITSIPTSVTVDGIALAARTEIPEDISGWFYDSATLRLYASVSTVAFSGWPNDQVISFSHEMFFSTEPVYTHRDPKDTATRKVHWEPWITEIPDVSRTVSDALAGFIPTTPSGLTITNRDQYFNQFFRNTSFNKAEIKMWRIYDGTSVELMLKTLISDFSTNYTTVSFTVNDDTEVFQNEIRPTQSGESDLYFPDDFPNIDPSFIGASKRILYGVQNLKGVNLNYDPDSTADTENNEWGVMAASMAENDLGLRSFYDRIDWSLMTIGSPTDRIFLKALDGSGGIGEAFVQLGDYILLVSTPPAYSDPPNYSSDRREITNVGSNFIDLSSTFTFNNVAGEDAFSSQVQRVYVSRNDGILIQLRPFFSFYCRKVNGVLTVKFFSGYASALGVDPVTTNDTVFCRAQGRKFLTSEFVPVPVSGLGNAGAVYDCAFRGAGILYDILRHYVGIPADEIDLDAFEAETLEDDSPDVSFCIPANVSDAYPTHQEVITKLLLSSGILRLYKNEELKWTISRVAQFSSPEAEITDNTLQDISSKYSYRDILSELTIKFGHQERTLDGVDNFFEKHTFFNAKAKHFHKIDRSKEIELFVFSSAYVDGITVGNFGSRLYGLFAERQGLHSVEVAKDFNEFVRINDEYLVSRTKIGGLAFTGSPRNLKTRVVEVKRSQNKVSLLLDDQLGLGDNE